ncbi:very long chain fatty acid elongase 7 isoform X2 [Bombus vancouverensis nearcticus]|uniref:very long chain fatty acid elongase 7 isoform X2 n=1 Tax=Bombus vancouverensis nearcticus TaxID=2705178 RepID=UPI00402BD767
MATLIRRIYQGYRYINEELTDPRTQDYFLIGSPWGCFSIVAFYLYFVHVLGPNIMAKRKPFNLNRILQIYNLIQIVSCAYIFHKITKIVWAYFLMKLLDLLDTAFFILRKKQQQVSFLHVYHHTGMALGSWAATKFLPGGHITFLGTLNSFVHMVMYTHYLATSLRISKPWWKKYVTQLQLTQFCLITIHFVMLAWVEDCGFPKWTAAVMIPQNLFMLMMFGDFYYKSYIKMRKIRENGVSSDVSNGKLKSQ